MASNSPFFYREIRASYQCYCCNLLEFPGHSCNSLFSIHVV